MFFMYKYLFEDKLDANFYATELAEWSTSTLIKILFIYLQFLYLILSEISSPCKFY